MDQGDQRGTGKNAGAFLKKKGVESLERQSCGPGDLRGEMGGSVAGVVRERNGLMISGFLQGSGAGMRPNAEAGKFSRE